MTRFGSPTPGLLDLDDVGPVLAEHQRRHGRRDVGADIEHAQPGQRQLSRGGFGRHGAILARLQFAARIARVL